MKSSIELKRELTELESEQAYLKREIARLESELSIAEKRLLELNGSRLHRGMIVKKECELREAEDREKVEKSPLAKWLNTKEKDGIIIFRVTPKRVYLRSFSDRFVSDEIVFSRETGKAVYSYSYDWIDRELTLDIPATLKAWNDHVTAGGVNT